MSEPARILVIACGAIARELVRIRELNGWGHVEFQCLPAELHNRPEKIPAAVLEMIAARRADYARLFVGYADCGTGGLLDRALQGTGVERIPGAHCYEFFAGSEEFHQLAGEEPGSFYLTDFLVRHFERLVVRGLGLDREPALLPVYFGNYRRVVYLAQTGDAELQSLARRHAEFLGLDYLYRFCGDRPLSLALKPRLALEETCQS
ncbi:MAG: DUF1638 domain-containing protein [Lysobacterales bacterium]|nr:MAG: DUF1638 domain-containing protein [Xanthomonadales bacterium]